PVAPHPALRATFSPHAGRREKTCAQLVGRRRKARASLVGKKKKARSSLSLPSTRGELLLSLLPACGGLSLSLLPACGGPSPSLPPPLGALPLPLPPACGALSLSLPPACGGLSLSLPPACGGLSLSLLPASGEKVPKADEGRFSRRACKHRLPRYRQRSAGRAASSNIATPVAPHPALRATFSPLVGRREKACNPLAGRRRKARSPPPPPCTRRSLSLFLLPACMEKVPNADERRLSLLAFKTRLPRYRQRSGVTATMSNSARTLPPSSSAP